jgi:ribosome biogenesis protein ERB1
MALQVVQYVRAIRNGSITFDKPKEEDDSYLLWEDDSGLTEKANHLAYVPAPKQKLPGIKCDLNFGVQCNIGFSFELRLVLIISFCFPGHDESYNPPLEYIPTQEEINSYQLMYEEDRPKFIPKRYCALSINIFDSVSLYAVQLIHFNFQVYIYEKHPCL